MTSIEDCFEVAVFCISFIISFGMIGGSILAIIEFIKEVKSKKKIICNYQ